MLGGVLLGKAEWRRRERAEAEAERERVLALDGPAAHHRQLLERVASGVKHCPHCRRDLDLMTGFGANRSEPDGRQPVCLDCHSKAERIRRRRAKAA